MNLLELLNIKTMEKSKKKVVLEMEIKPEHFQPFGIMHGGISCVLAETAASVGANKNLTDGQAAVGLDIHTNHLNPMKCGILTVTATPNKVGRSCQNWSVIIENQDKIISSSDVNLINKNR